MADNTDSPSESKIQQDVKGEPDPTVGLYDGADENADEKKYLDPR